MRSFITIIVGLMASCAMAQLPQLPPPPGGPPSLPPSQAPKLDLSIPEIKITPQPLPATPASSLIQIGNNTGPVKPGDKVRVKTSTNIYSSDNEKAYRCGQLNAGQEVVVLDLPDPGSKFATIACPDNCYALIPTEYVYPRVFLIHKQPPNYMKQQHPVTGNIVPLVDGTPANGIYQPAKNELRTGTLVTVRDEKAIQINGKTKLYCVITTAGKDIRYVHAADLDGVFESPSAVSPPPGFQMNQPSTPLYNNNRPTTPWPPPEPVQQSTYESVQLSPQSMSLIQEAERAYQRGMQTGVWEDARMRYQQMLDSDPVSVRVLAKNRLEFIRDWQQSPPVQTAARTNSEPTYAISNSGPWIPGEVAARLPRQPAMTTSIPMSVPVRDVVVRPTAPVATTSNPNTFANPSRPASPLDIPVPPGVGGTQQQQLQQPPPGFTPSGAHPTVSQPQPQKQATQPALPVSAAGTNPNRLPAQPTTAPQAQRVTNILGVVRLAVYNSGRNQLYYLVNSNGDLTHYLRGSQLRQFVNQRVRLEGVLSTVPIEGKMQQLIQVDKIELLK